MNYDTFESIDYFTNLNDFDMNDFMDNMDNNMINNNMNNQNISLYNPYEAYIKGNLFKNLYNGYKNYKPATIKINNEQAELLLNVNQISFLRHELNLYLDNYPNNQNALDLFNRYRKMEDEAIKNYERRFGPLEVSSEINNTTPFAWEKTKWPWEM